MSNKNMFEELLEHIVNGEEAKAEELFHNIVVTKSREIYENLIESDLEEVDIEEASKDEEEMDESREEDEEEMDESAESDDEEMDESADEEMDEAADDEEMDENFGMEDEEVGGDAADDMMHDVEGGDEEGGEEGEGSVEDRVDDLEDALEDLKAEFEKLMGDEAGEEEHGDMDMDMGDDEADEMAAPAFEEEVEEIDLSPAAMMREYVDKVGEAYKGGKVASSSEASGANTKSVVAKKNDMGGTTANIAKGGTGSEKGTKGGLLDPSTKPQDGGNVNVPGAKNATKLSAVSKGHGAEKKGAGESGANTKSLF